MAEGKDTDTEETAPPTTNSPSGKSSCKARDRKSLGIRNDDSSTKSTSSSWNTNVTAEPQTKADTEESSLSQSINVDSEDK